MDTEATPHAQGANVRPNVIRANQFMLEDKTGTVRAELVVRKNGPGLMLLDETGKGRVELRACEKIPNRRNRPIASQWNQ